MREFASTTSVPIERSAEDIRKILRQNGADKIGMAESKVTAEVVFWLHNRMIRVMLRLPDRQEKRFWETPARRTKRSETEAYKAWEQACRSRWRALADVIKAKFVAIQAGITTFNDEFLAFTALPGGGTVSEMLQPQVEQAYLSGAMPVGLLMLPATAGEDKT